MKEMEIRIFRIEKNRFYVWKFYIYWLNYVFG